MPPLTLISRLGRGVLAAALALGIGIAPAAALDDAQRKEFETVIRDYLLKNPEVIQEAIGELQKRQAAVEAGQRQQALAGLKPQIFDSAHAVTIGNPKGDITLVEFFDYNCGYCKHALADMQKLVQNDPKLRVVLKEFPVLGPGSVEAAQVAVAVRLLAPDKYYAFHQKLLGDRGQANKAKALAVASDLGIDTAAIEAKLTDPEINATLQESLKLADALGIDGTPSYVVGDTVIVGAVGHDQIRKALDSVRNCGKAQC
ncbi:protein-disulfide isomerase [Angulomicrobium tetraedrale]|uniref:Protein-disulfide isomerase n=1 Tax=Ancylobacter tetraedralis TaxID=217068 RepID=A0A839Z848_9HYPH|nr:DsbA family protein [Ancylobacter tetraedralis]MBB3770325.1 protein-disulfide isomerase [Ancylobacter tetraedralis]